MFRDRMKLLTTVLVALSLLVGELAFSAAGVALAASQPANPVAATMQPAARWVRCTFNGVLDENGNYWCWATGARYFLGNGYYLLRNGRFVFIESGRYFLRGRFFLPAGMLVRNGYILRNGRVIGYEDTFGYPYFYYLP